MTKINSLNLLATLLCLLIAAQVNSQDVSDLEFFFEDELNSDPLEFKLTTDFKVLQKEKAKGKNKDAKFTFYFENGDSTTVSGKIKARGVFRRKHCHMPPLWLNFKKGDFSNSSIKQFDKVKLVSYCRESTSYTQHLLQEYYIYKAYELLTEYSFRTRLVKIYYEDLGRNKDPGWYFGFLIEDADQMAERNNSINVEVENVHPESTNREMATVTDIFQMMIGNTDYSVPGLHNVKLLKSNEVSQYQPVAVPYDFDYCGLINATYAVPPESLNIASVQDRIYRGFCREEAEFQAALAKIFEKEEEIIALFENSPYLDKRYKNDAVTFMKESFKILHNDQSVRRYLYEGCRTKS